MQSRLAATATKFNRTALLGRPKQLLTQRLGYGGASSTGRTADPAVHAVEPEEVGAADAIHDEKQRHSSPDQHDATGKDAESYVHPKSATKSGLKLESPGVAHRMDPIAQQKRRNSNSRSSTGDLGGVSCAGVDGGPWPEDDSETDSRRQREEQERDNKEYFEHHKASPLSEIEMADTRKPIDRASDGAAGGYFYAVTYDGSQGKVWRPEQVDTAEESLRRAMEIYRRNAERGDPESPHGRVLRQMRGEYW